MMDWHKRMELARRPVTLCISFSGVELPQEHLAMCPGKVKNAICQVSVLILVHQLQAAVARFAHAGNQVGSCGLPWFQRDMVADSNNWDQAPSPGCRTVMASPVNA